MKTHLDLFSGIGGFALAAGWAGFRTIGFSEIEPYACKVLKRHWPDVPNYGDIRNVVGVPADLVTGGFPCQPFSLAGKRRGKADNRHLWPEMCRVIAESRPAWVLAENVPGIIGMELDSVLSDLEIISYTCGTIVIPACAVDARHRRDRVWVVAHAHANGRSTRAFNETDQPSIRDLSEGGSQTLADGLCTGLEEWQEQPAREELQATKRSGAFPNADVVGRAAWCPSVSQCEGWRTLVSNPMWWEPEPELGRVANGIPYRVDRLKGLGNAIVPQVAAQIIKAMIKSEL